MRPKYFNWMSLPDQSVFIALSKELRAVQGNFASAPNAIAITRPSRNLSRCALVCVKIVRGGLENNDKLSNFRLHNHMVYVNI